MRRFLRDLTMSVCAGALLLLAQPSTLAAPPSTTPHRAVLTRVSPLYPELARRMGVTGTVTVQALVLPNGTVSGIRILSGHGLLRQAAGDAVRLWRFAADPASTEPVVAVVFELSQ